MKIKCAGILILSFLFCISLQAMQVRVIVHQPVLPVLALKKANPVLRLTFIKEGGDACRVRELVCSLAGTITLADVDSVCLYGATGKDGLAMEKTVASPLPSASTVVFSNPFSLQADTTVVWVTVRLKDKINLKNRIEVACTSVKTDEGQVEIIVERSPIGLRTGIAVRHGGQDGVNTSRIPGIATSPKGTLLAIYDARYESSRDLQGHMDIAMNRSTDGGNTWLPIQIVLDMKQWGGLPEKYNGVSDACILVDDCTGVIYVAGLWMHGVLDGKTGKWVEGMARDSTRWAHQWKAKGSQPGVGVRQTAQFLITRSTDDGQTWSEPVNITAVTKRPEWWLYAPAPGHGITLKDGTLVFPTQGRDENGLPFSNIAWSKDEGKSWTAGNPAYDNTTECMAVELSNGDIMLNMRDNRNRRNRDINGRRICVTADLGKTWSEHATSRKALIEPTCMASIHRHVYRQDGEEKSVLLFCNPESYDRREHMTLKVSFDEGETWPDDKKILLDEYAGFGYSCITSVDEATVGLFYESSQAQMVFQQIGLEELIGEKSK